MLSFEEYFHPQFKSFLKEGLIKTYPIDHLQKALNRASFKTNSMFAVSDDVVERTEASKVLTCILSSWENNKNFITDAKLDLNTIKTIADVFGFFIGRITKFTKGGRPTKLEDETFHYKISIEPKYPSTANIDTADFYHITYDRYIPKIEKIGLTPRTSKTSFSHPGNRVYLVKSNRPWRIADLMTAISNDRLENIPSDISSKGKAAIDVYKTLNDRSNMVLYKVDTDGLKLYDDPMVNPDNNLSAFFTTQNISPDRLTLLSS